MIGIILILSRSWAKEDEYRHDYNYTNVSLCIVKLSHPSYMK